MIKTAYKPLLLLLTLLFTFRILCQFALQYTEISFLPEFDLWHSSTMPYSALLSIQCILLSLMLVGVFACEKYTSPKLAKTLLFLGWVYIALMVSRLIIGVWELSTHSWFDGAISTAFHFGLAAYILVFGASFNKAESTERSSHLLFRYAAYPILLIGSYLLFLWLTKVDSPLLFSAYLSILVGVFGIILHEAFAPHRQEWSPKLQDICSDSLFLVVIQISLPAVLKATALFFLVWLSHNTSAPCSSFWPHDAPVLIQLCIMLLVAEFFRYWIHRGIHKSRKLWRFHAVHHAADKLYTINVGRFHPFDKALQFIGDSLPFLLLGVSSEVLATYFVLYAVNGFYQHSNTDVRLGFLNWIIAGPELHRWHHSAKISEGHSNYGNNLIIWDVVFGTRFLPKNRQVDSIGIKNTDWPKGFFLQMSAPFTEPTEVRSKK